MSTFIWILVIILVIIVCVQLVDLSVISVFAMEKVDPDSFAKLKEKAENTKTYKFMINNFGEKNQNE